jgi:hypothetical protein
MEGGVVSDGGVVQRKAVPAKGRAAPPHFARARHVLARAVLLNGDAAAGIRAALDHAQVIERWDSEYRKLPWEAFGAHYLQMVGAMGGAECRAKGEALSEYENARGTGNIHMWFNV